jgi:uncharacterized membrane protein (UPF0127 family)
MPKRRERRKKSNYPKPKNIRRRAIIFAIPLVLFSVAGYYMMSGPKTAEISIGDCRVNVEIADKPDFWEKGLSGRKKLAEGEGMLFVFDFQRRYSFWMKDTSIPLSIAFISSDGRITQIEQMTPFDPQPVTPRSSVKYALEVNHGFFQENGITVGMQVDLTNVVR